MDSTPLPLTIFALVVFLVPAGLGVRATYRLWRLVFYDGETRASKILVSFAIVASIITLAALWFGFSITRRLLGFDALPLEVAGPIGLILSAAVLLIPAGLERLVAYIGRTTR